MDNHAEIIEVVGPVTPRPMDTMLSARLDPEMAALLRDRAKDLAMSMSDLLRVGAEMVLSASDREIERAMQCASCGGTGKRRWQLRDGDDYLDAR
jgi:hypothetical protein